MRLHRPILFVALSCVMTLFPMLFGHVLWPDGLSAGLENVFWPASGVHVALLLRWGMVYAPLAAVGTFLAQILTSRPWDTSLVNALGNAAEALLVAWAVRRWAGSGEPLQRVRGVFVFLAASTLAPLLSSIPGVLTLIARGWISPDDYLEALVVWTAANACGIILLAPFLLSLRAESWRGWHPTPEWFVWLIASLGGGWLAFEAVFRGGGTNYAFLFFPFIIHAAVRLGVAQTSAALVLVFAFVYVALAHTAPIRAAGQIHDELGFTQSYCIVLGATGLLLAALTRENQQTLASLKREQARSLEAGIRAERARLDALRYQINPHFLFNSLNSIRATLPLELAAPREMITRLADYLRATLYRNHRDLVPLSEEIRLLEHYLDMEKIRFGDTLVTRIEISPEAAACPVPVLLLQPLVENAIRHGFEQSQGVFQLHVTARHAGDRLLITVANTGDWRPSPTDGRRGLGLANVRRRLALLHGEAGRLDVASADGWVSIELQLPLPPPLA